MNCWNDQKCLNFMMFLNKAYLKGASDRKVSERKTRLNAPITVEAVSCDVSLISDTLC